MDNAITDLLDAVIPELGKMVSDMQFWLGFAMLIGPLCLVLAGVYFWFFAPKEANHKAGYRTYYGMGSVAAWQFTQSFAGRIFSFMGAGLLILAIVGCVLVAMQEPEKAALSGLIILALEALATVIGYGVIELTVSGKYDAEGNPKK